MKYLKTFGLAMIAAGVLMVITGAGTASATLLTKEGGATVTTGSTIHAAAEGTTTLHGALDISCSGSTVQATTNNESGTAITGNISSLTFTGCGSWTVKVINTEEKDKEKVPSPTGSLSIESAGRSNGTLKSTGTEVTVEGFGLHCIYKTNNTTIGTLTGSTTTGSTSTLDITGEIPRTGGRSEMFCGGAAEWTGSYSIDTPMTLNVD